MLNNHYWLRFDFLTLTQIKAMATLLTMNHEKMLERNRKKAFANGKPYSYFLDETTIRIEYPDGRPAVTKKHSNLSLVAKKETILQ